MRSMVITTAMTLYVLWAILHGFLHYASKDQMLNHVNIAD